MCREEIRMIEISKEQAIKVMEENLKILKECSDSDTFLLLSFDLKENKSLGRKRVNFKAKFCGFYTARIA